MDSDAPIKTVSDLIAVLQRYPPNAEVIFHDEEIAIYRDVDAAEPPLAQISDSGFLEHALRDDRSQPSRPGQPVPD